MKLIYTILQKLRANLWWNHLISPLTGFIYICIFWSTSFDLAFFFILLLFLISILGTAGFGYWINDWSDYKQDLKVGKSNATVGFTNIKKLLIAGGLLVLGATPWLIMDYQYYALFSWMTLLVCLLFYSLPPIRFKERGFMGIVCDMAYGHLLPVWISLGIFTKTLNTDPTYTENIFIYLSFYLILKGLRNIIQHQIEDRKNDQLLQLNTFVNWFGALRSAYFLSFILIPLEVLLLSFFLFKVHWILGISLIFFIITYALRIWSWKFARTKSVRQIFRIWFVFNDYYEGTFPLASILLLLLKSKLFFFLLPIHIFIFPKSTNHWIRKKTMLQKGKNNHPMK